MGAVWEILLVFFLVGDGLAPFFGGQLLALCGQFVDLAPIVAGSLLSCI